MSDRVDAVIERMLGREGGYSDHPADTGGPTRWGVTQAVARAFGYAGDMKTLPRVRAKAIYLSRYWLQPGFAAIADRAPTLAEELFDCGVNQGPERAATYLQRALNIFNREGADYPDLKVDGRIGPMTLAALDALLARRGAMGEVVLVRACDSLQGARYVKICEARAANEAFAVGWFSHRVGPLS